MNKNIVVYYSNNGSNRYLAGQIADKLQCDIEEIVPIIKSHILLLMGLGIGIRKIKSRLSSYDRVILCAPIWAGQLIFPVRKFVKKYGKELNKLHFVTCCGSSYEMKDHKFGHELVFQKLRVLMPGQEIKTDALPITLTLSAEEKEDGNKVMQTRLNDSNFNGIFLEEYNKLLKILEEK